jgi:hypothetical protein
MPTTTFTVILFSFLGLFQFNDEYIINTADRDGEFKQADASEDEYQKVNIKGKKVI